ncbi:hypothetical protein ABS71_13895 [bacterium SCN 62-11]|nr:UvrB/UvrC motif-containing protein [Candidatus Eremiobacteraeota bacterium]ODT63828.1 MAG: hypothetical protein ABS71_13895 [bacterium SCN 62-11]
MYCQRCQMRPANRTVHDQWGQPHAFCEVCATQVQVFGTLQKMLLPALMQPNLPAQQSCPGCHISWQQLQQQSHLGCPECYRHFRGALAATMSRLHGHTEHRGRHPARPAGPEKPKVETLREQLDQAVSEERFEDAAELRDQLRKLQEGNS